MPSDLTRRMLKRFGVAVTDLEDAIDRRAPAEEIGQLDADLAVQRPDLLGRRAAVEEIGQLDADLAVQMRETFAYVDQLRSRRIA